MEGVWLAARGELEAQREAQAWLELQRQPESCCWLWRPAAEEGAGYVSCRESHPDALTDGASCSISSANIYTEMCCYIIVVMNLTLVGDLQETRTTT